MMCQSKLINLNSKICVFLYIFQLPSNGLNWSWMWGENVLHVLIEMEKVSLKILEWKETKYDDVFVNSGTCYPGVLNVFPVV